jgi:hypothetical protein
VTSASMQADYNQPHNYDRSSGGYNQPSSGWTNADKFAPAGQTLYPSAPNYNPQIGVPHHATTPAVRYSTNPVYDMNRTSPSAADYQSTDSRHFRSTTDNSEGGHPTSSYSGIPPPLYVSTVDTHASRVPVSATTWNENAPRDHHSYSRQDEYPSGQEQSSSSRIISGDPGYFPAEPSRAVPVDTQSTWSTQVHHPYDDDELELTGQEEAQATRRHRRDSVSTRSGGRSGDSHRESDRYPRDRRRK